MSIVGRLESADEFHVGLRDKTLIPTTLAVVLYVTCSLLLPGSTIVSQVELVQFLCLSLALLHVPVLLVGIMRGVVPVGAAWLVCVAGLTGLGLFLPERVLSVLSPVIYVIGFSAAVYHCLKAVASQTIIKLAATGLVCLIVGFLGISAAWGDFRIPLVIHALESQHTMHNQDPWFEAALIGSIQNYGIPSVAADGTPYLPYHHAMHFFLAAIANLTGCRPIEAIVIAFPIILLPGYVLLWQSVVTSIARLTRPAQSRPQVASFVSFWLLFVVGHVGVLPMGFRATFSLFNNFFNSATFTVSLMVLYAFSDVVLCRVIRGGGRRPVSDLVAGVIIGLTAGILLTWCKTTTAHLWLGATWFLAIRSSGHARRYVTGMALASAVGYFIAARWVNSGYVGSGLRFEFMGFWKLYLHSDEWGIYPLLASFWCLVYLIGGLRERGLLTVADLRDAFRNRSAVDLELAGLLAVLGLVPGVVLGGPMSFSTMYYPEATGFVAAAMVSARVLMRSTSGEKTGLRHRSLAWIGTSAALVWGAMISGADLYHVNRIFLHLTTQYQGNSCAVPLGIKPNGSGPNLSQTLKSGNIRAAWNLMSDNLRQTEETLSETDRLLGQLIELGRLPQPEKKATVLFIPRGQGLWTHFGLDKEWGTKASFIPVGISGLALLDGMPGSTDGSRPFYFGLDGYGEPRFSDGFTDESLLARARELGFSRVFILQPDSSGHWHRRVIGD